MTASPAARTAWTTAEVTQMAVLGAIFWFAFAMLVRALEPFGLLHGSARAVTFLIAIPGTILFIFAVRAVLRYPAARMAEIIGVITAFAIVLDGLAFGWFPTIYGRDPQHQIAGAGLLLWGGGIGILTALAIQTRVAR